MMKIFAHRGSSLVWPENTLYAFRKAHDAGATGFETDLRLSADNEIILAHDDNLARFGQPDKTVSLLRQPEIEKIKIASPDGKYADNIITLRTLLQTYPDKDYILDCKISERLLFEKLQTLLQELRFHERIWFLTWSSQGDEHIREFFPGRKIFPRFARVEVWGMAAVVGLGRLFEPKCEILSLPAYFRGLKVFSKRQIKDLKKRQKTFMGYLVNSRKDFEHCRACGIDLFLTDRPDLIATFSKD